MPVMENMKKENVSRLAIRKAATISPNATVRDAIERMRLKRVGCCIGIDLQHKPIGMFTEAMLTQLLSRNPTVVDDPITDHFSQQSPWVALDDPIVNVLEALEVKNIRFLCVVDDDGRVCGLTGQKGLMEYIAEHFPKQVAVQRVGGRPFPASREGA